MIGSIKFCLILILSRCTDFNSSYDCNYIESLINNRKIFEAKSLLESGRVIGDNLTIYKLLGQSYYQETQYTEAEKYFNRALEFCKTKGDSLSIITFLLANSINSNRPELIDSFFTYIKSSSSDPKYLAYSYYRYKALNFYLLKQFKEASVYCDSAITHLSNSDIYRIDNLKIYDLAAMIYSSKGDYLSALKLNDLAIHATCDTCKVSFSDLRNIPNMAFLIGNRAKITSSAAINQCDTNMAKKSLYEFYLADSLLNDIVIFDNETFILNNFYHNNLYSYIIKHLSWMYSNTYDEKYLIKILNYIYKYKGRSLKREIGLSNFSNVNELVKQYYSEYSLLEMYCFQEINGARPISKNNFIQKSSVINHLNELGSQIRIEIPNLFGDIFLLKNNEIERIIEKTASDTIARIYFYLGNDFYNNDDIFILTLFKGKIGLKIISNANEILNTLKNLNYAEITLALINRSNIHLNEFVNSFIDSYSKIKTAKYIKIIPDNLITKVSFDLLTIDSLNSTKPVFMFDRHNISYSYSVAEEVPLFSKNDYKYDFSGFGFSSKETTMKAKESGLKELPQSLLELKNILNLFPNDKKTWFIGRDCTLKNFFVYASKCKYLHLAIHGEHGTNRLNSKLYFRRIHDCGIDTVYSYQLLDHSIRPELVVLSTCEAGTGKMQFEEGSFSIGRSFISLGANYVVSSQGNVSDKYSKEIFISFYNYISNGYDYIFSLAQAKRDFVNTHPEMKYNLQNWIGIDIYH